MKTEDFFTAEEYLRFNAAVRSLSRSLLAFLNKKELKKLQHLIADAAARECYNRDRNGINGLLRNLETARIAADEMGLKRGPLIAQMLYRPVFKKIHTTGDVEKLFDTDAAQLVERLLRTSELYARNTAVDSENFHRLLFSFAEDVRVILLMLADRLYMMRVGKQIADDEQRLRLAREASYLYAPLAHRLGLYAIKGELEDLSLKYTDPQQFAFIKEKLSETKQSRDAYIARFIAPVKEKLTEEGFLFDIKGRTKSIHSINNKLRKQQTEFEKIYDLFAIRVILDMPFDSINKERSECWRAFSIITNMYQPNPKRMKDWISIPKSNGYESLHTTVMGPREQWVEVQIRTRRMDEIAEKGLAAHWKYKGVKEDSGLDQLLANVRLSLENKDTDPYDLMQNFRMDLYSDEIYVFTPKGALLKLPKGATVLDFAFAVHTEVGSRCVSARVNDRNVPIRHVLNNGDTVAVQTQPTQSPKPGWLSFVSTSKARIKIKQALREDAAKNAEYGKELLQRRFKNRKIELSEPTLMRLIKKKGYKTVTDFYLDIAESKLDSGQFIDEYLDFDRKEKEFDQEVISAGTFTPSIEMEEMTTRPDILVIDKNLTGIEYKLSKCCNPIFGDEIFAFVSTQGIKIHRVNCPNEHEMRERFGYRIVEARWSGKGANDYVVDLLVLGRDDIGIVTNITSVISKENGIALRTIRIDSGDGFFQGHFGVIVKDSRSLATLIGKIKAVKGVSAVTRQ
ncbi:MAG: HD domain-containing protein [Tannerellaceae bacterium]|jgi:GTP pyrophosphokinase|nr:HD domain-containing protein [Tannerellaceae bacterium]